MSTTTTTRIAAARTFARTILVRLRRDYVFALGVLAVVAALAAVIQTLGTACSRMNYPFVLEWMEGATVDHVRVVLSGDKLYRRPSIAWTPAIYTPFYYWVCAVFMKVFGVSLFWTRFVSTLSLAGALCLMGQFVRKEVGGVVGPVVAAGLFSVTFPVTGAWVDLARVDSLFLVLFLAGAYLARHGTGRPSAIAAGGLLFLAFFTKQTALLLAMPVLAGAVLLSWRRGLIVAGVFGALTIGAIQWMDLASDGWFRYYVFKVPSKHSLPPPNEWPKFLLMSLWEPMPLGVALAFCAIGGGPLKGWRVSVFYAGVLLVTGVAGFSSLIKNGGFINAMIPYCAALAILSGIAIGWALQQSPESTVGRRLQAAAALAAVVQLGARAYDQRRFVPRNRDIKSGMAMIAKWTERRADGAVYSFGFGYYDVLAGGNELHAHSMAIADIVRTDDRENAQRLRDEMVDAIQRRRYPTIVWDDSAHFVDPGVEAALRRHYKQSGSLFGPGEDDRVWPRTGFQTRPNQVWIPK